jgi:hypothetical protein
MRYTPDVKIKRRRSTIPKDYYKRILEKAFDLVCEDISKYPDRYNNALNELNKNPPFIKGSEKENVIDKIKSQYLYKARELIK